MVRIDFIFSYWIFFWYLLYLTGLVKYNPKFAILCGLFENLFIILLMIYYKTKARLLFLFFIMFVLLKVIPLYSIWATKINWNDIKFTFILFAIYLFWTFYNKKTFSDFQLQTYKLIFHNKNTLPGMIFLDKMCRL
jgi:hypothetical protein